jgi:hypothetical protein
VRKRFIATTRNYTYRRAPDLSTYQLLCHHVRPLELAEKSADIAVIGGPSLQQKGSDMTARELEEYTALRATIRERGTVRVWIFLAGLAVWAALLVATAALGSVPIATLLPLLVLAAVFEVVFALHTGVERIGRYIQVFFEAPGERGWEHTAMAFGRTFPGGASDPLFAPYFALATVANLLSAALARPRPFATEWVVVAVPHLLFLARLWRGRRRSAAQRAVDLERFENLKNQTS